MDGLNLDTLFDAIGKGAVAYATVQGAREGVTFAPPPPPPPPPRIGMILLVVAGGLVLLGLALWAVKR